MLEQELRRSSTTLPPQTGQLQRILHLVSPEPMQQLARLIRRLTSAAGGQHELWRRFCERVPGGVADPTAFTPEHLVQFLGSVIYLNRQIVDLGLHTRPGGALGAAVTHVAQAVQAGQICGPGSFHGLPPPSRTPDSGRVVFVGGLPSEDSVEALLDEMLQTWNIKGARRFNPKSGKAKWCALFELESGEDAQAVIARYDRRPFQGAWIGVRLDSRPPLRADRAADAAPSPHGGGVQAQEEEPAPAPHLPRPPPPPPPPEAQQPVVARDDQPAPAPQLLQPPPPPPPAEAQQPVVARDDQSAPALLQPFFVRGEEVVPAPHLPWVPPPPAEVQQPIVARDDQPAPAPQLPKPPPPPPPAVQQPVAVRNEGPAAAPELPRAAPPPAAVQQPIVVRDDQPAPTAQQPQPLPPPPEVQQPVAVRDDEPTLAARQPQPLPPPIEAQQPVARDEEPAPASHLPPPQPPAEVQQPAVVRDDQPAPAPKSPRPPVAGPPQLEDPLLGRQAPAQPEPQAALGAPCEPGEAAPGGDPADLVEEADEGSHPHGFWYDEQDRPVAWTEDWAVRWYSPGCVVEPTAIQPLRGGGFQIQLGSVHYRARYGRDENELLWDGGGSWTRGPSPRRRGHASRTGGGVQSELQTSGTR